VTKRDRDHELALRAFCAVEPVDAIVALLNEARAECWEQAAKELRRFPVHAMVKDVEGEKWKRRARRLRKEAR